METPAGPETASSSLRRSWRNPNSSSRKKSRNPNDPLRGAFRRHVRGTPVPAHGIRPIARRDGRAETSAWIARSPPEGLRPDHGTLLETTAPRGGIRHGKTSCPVETAPRSRKAPADPMTHPAPPPKPVRPARAARAAKPPTQPETATQEAGLPPPAEPPADTDPAQGPLRQGLRPVQGRPVRKRPRSYWAEFTDTFKAHAFTPQRHLLAGTVLLPAQGLRPSRHPVSRTSIEKYKKSSKYRSALLKAGYSWSHLGKPELGQAAPAGKWSSSSPNPWKRPRPSGPWRKCSYCSCASSCAIFAT